MSQPCRSGNCTIELQVSAALATAGCSSTDLAQRAAYAKALAACPAPVDAPRQRRHLLPRRTSQLRDWARRRDCSAHPILPAAFHTQCASGLRRGHRRLRYTCARQGCTPCVRVCIGHTPNGYGKGPRVPVTCSTVSVMGAWRSEPCDTAVRTAGKMSRPMRRAWHRRSRDSPPLKAR